jgi:hypothetical protein
LSGDYSLDGASDVDRIRRTCGSVRNHCCQIVAGFGIGPALKATQPKVGQRLDPAVDDTVSEIRIEDTRSRSDRSCCGHRAEARSRCACATQRTSRSSTPPYLSDDTGADWTALLAGLRICARIAEAPALRDVIVKIARPQRASGGGRGRCRVTAPLVRSTTSICAAGCVTVAKARRVRDLRTRRAPPRASSRRAMPQAVPDTAQYPYSRARSIPEGDAAVRSEALVRLRPAARSSPWAIALVVYRHAG